MDSEQFLKDIQGKNINFLIGSGASAGVVPTLWVASINKSFEDLLTSDSYSVDQKKYYIIYGLSFGFVKRKLQTTIRKIQHIFNIITSSKM